jgi:hypothetical protein
LLVGSLHEVLVVDGILILTLLNEVLDSASVTEHVNGLPSVLRHNDTTQVVLRYVLVLETEHRALCVANGTERKVLLELGWLGP